MPALQGRSEGILDPMTAVSPTAKSWADAVASPGPVARAPIADAKAPTNASDDATSEPALPLHRRTTEVVARHLTRHHEEFRQLQPSSSLVKTSGLVDVLYHEEDDPHHPDEVFGRLRWGGLFVYASRDAERVHGLSHRFEQRGYVTLQGPDFVRKPILGLKLPLLSPKLHYYVARKVFLVRPREVTERFTYHVQLIPDGDGTQGEDGGYIVSKEVPTLERVVARLRAKFTDLPYALIEKRARKFTEKIFPLFLTREAAMLKILERDLPREFKNRVPRVLDLEQDGKGYVRKMQMTWLRQGTTAPLSQIEFARQAAELLNVVHDTVGIIHLDLRLDNFVITPDGVCFVDFGSSVRVGENIHGNPMLSTIFEELMRTSQIQRMLYKMKSSGLVTSTVISEAYQRVDKAVDLFYLAVQMNQPLNNPDFEGLVQFDVNSPEAKGLEKLTHEILHPADPAKPPYRTARDVLAGIRNLERSLKNGSA
jgi:hypothetical protein